MISAFDWRIMLLNILFILIFLFVVFSLAFFKIHFFSNHSIKTSLILTTFMFVSVMLYFIIPKLFNEESNFITLAIFLAVVVIIFSLVEGYLDRRESKFRNK